MCNYLIDINGNQYWYDLKSDKHTNEINYRIHYFNEPTFYIRPHRESGPAIIIKDYVEEYLFRGIRHREDGPALIWNGGDTSWWLNGYWFWFDNWCKELEKLEEEINFLKLKWNIT